jgi:predicted transcriptional regulator
MFINIDWGKKGQSLKDFQQLKIDSHKLMSKGLVFVWAPKNSISELLTIMEKK